MLIDGVGGGYFRSATYGRLREAGVPVDRFLHSYAAVEHAVPQPAQPSQAAGGRRPPRLHRRHQHRRRERAGDQPGASGARHAFPRRRPGGRRSSSRPSPTTGLSPPARSCSTRPGFPSSRRAAMRSRACVTSGPDEDLEQIEFAIAARHHLRAPLDPHGHAVLPAARHADHRRSALAAMRGIEVDIFVPEQSNHRVLDWARRIPLRTCWSSRLPRLADAAAVRPFQADDASTTPGR